MKRNSALVASFVLAAAAVAYSGPATKRISSSDKRAARILAVEELAALHSSIDFDDPLRKDGLDFRQTMVKQFAELLDEESWTTKFFNARQKLTLEEKEDLAAIEGGENEIWKLANGWVVYVRGIRANKASCVQCHHITTGPRDLEDGDLISAVRIELKAE